MTNHKQTIRTYLAAFNRGDLDAFDALIAPVYRNNDPLRPELHRGLDALKTVVAEMRAAFPDLRYDEVALIEEDDVVAAHVLVHGVADHPVRQIQIERFDGERITEHWRATNPA
jgi:predicted SnoaL-like aldol condensation-catalyzing enzyme